MPGGSTAGGSFFSTSFLTSGFLIFSGEAIGAASFWLGSVTDFADDDEVDEAKMLWTNQISSLKQVLGSA